jgi:hypothetical protein
MWFSVFPIVRVQGIAIRIVGLSKCLRHMNQEKQKEQEEFIFCHIQIISGKTSRFTQALR